MGCHACCLPRFSVPVVTSLLLPGVPSTELLPSLSTASWEIKYVIWIVSRQRNVSKNSHSSKVETIWDHRGQSPQSTGDIRKTTKDVGAGQRQALYQSRVGEAKNIKECLRVQHTRRQRVAIATLHRSYTESKKILWTIFDCFKYDR